MKADKTLLTHFENMYFGVEMDMGASMPSVCANMERPPKESTAVMQVI